MKNILVLTLFSFFLAACSSQEKEVSVDAYLADKDLLKTKLADCNSKIATLADAQVVYSQGNCRNAKLAQRQVRQQRNDPNNFKYTKRESVYK